MLTEIKILIGEIIEMALLMSMPILAFVVAGAIVTAWPFNRDGLFDELFDDIGTEPRVELSKKDNTYSDDIEANKLINGELDELETEIERVLERVEDNLKKINEKLKDE